jgi:predicted PurR-regulated permease PerM
VLVLYVSLLAATVGIGFLLLPTLIREVGTVLAHLPTYIANFNAMMDQLTASIRHVLLHVIPKHANRFAIPLRADNMMEGALYKLPGGLLSVAHWGLWVFIIPFVCFFALREGRDWIDKLFDLTPSEYVENLLGLMAELNATLGGYVRGQILDALCVGVFTMFGLFILGFDGAVLMGCLTGFLNLVPFMAPIVGGSVALLLGYFQGLPTSTLFGIFCLFVLVRLFDDFVFTPFVLGSSVKLHPIVMLFAILAGFELGGFLGLVFAVPAAAVIKVILSITVHNHREAVLFHKQHIIS